MFSYIHMSPGAEALGKKQKFVVLTHTNMRGGNSVQVSPVPDSQHFNT